MRATVYFAREESYSTAVYTSEDEELELIPDGKEVGDPKPPLAKMRGGCNYLLMIQFWDGYGFASLLTVQ